MAEENTCWFGDYSPFKDSDTTEELDDMTDKSSFELYCSDGDNNDYEKFLNIEDALHFYEETVKVVDENYTITIVEFIGKKWIRNLEREEIETAINIMKFGYL